MIAEAAKTFLEFLKLAPRYLIALGVMAAVLLFSSEVFLKFIGVFEFAQNNRPMLGLTLVVTGALFAVSVAGDNTVRLITNITYKSSGYYDASARNIA